MPNSELAPAEEIPCETKQAWHTPEIIKAEINHDTAFSTGSVSDGDSSTVSP
jgi:hypothetical protein